MCPKETSIFEVTIVDTFSRRKEIVEETEENSVACGSSVARLHDDIAMYNAFLTSSDHAYLRISLCG